MVVNELLMQFQANVLNVPVLRPRTIETTALGAAYAAGLAVGYWQDTDDLARNWGVTHTWTPAMSQDRRTALTDSWRKAIGRSFDWV
jgi:glycerol kinase